MLIGSYKLENNLVLAPMAGVTDRPFRQLCRSLGAGLAVSEMISADASLWGSRKTVKRLDHRGESGPIAVQILGSDPGMMAEAARANVEFGAEIIDINMGCPAKKVCRKAAGSALLQNETLVAEILQRVVEAVEVPVTLKIRTGQNPQQKNAMRIAAIAEAAGIQALAVHGRTRACKFAGEAEYETIAAIKRTVNIPVIANGDIDSPEKAKQVLEATGADGLMIGRAAQGRPWIFRQIDHYLRTGHKLPAPQPQWVAEVLLAHLSQLYEFYGERMGTRIARKHIAWYSKEHPGGARFRDRINRTESARQQLGYTRDYFACLQDKGDLAA
ncbi:MAG: tRNA dihydrouridine synthase DusB [Candidatus Thiodiazotropha sp.]